MVFNSIKVLLIRSWAAIARRPLIPFVFSGILFLVSVLSSWLIQTHFKIDQSYSSLIYSYLGLSFWLMIQFVVFMGGQFYLLKAIREEAFQFSDLLLVYKNQGRFFSFLQLALFEVLLFELASLALWGFAVGIGGLLGSFFRVVLRSKDLGAFDVVVGGSLFVFLFLCLGVLVVSIYTYLGFSRARFLIFDQNMNTLNSLKASWRMMKNNRSFYLWIVVLVYLVPLIWKVLATYLIEVSIDSATSNYFLKDLGSAVTSWRTVVFSLPMFFLNPLFFGLDAAFYERLMRASPSKPSPQEGLGEVSLLTSE
jgi:hypothetical protein